MANTFYTIAKQGLLDGTIDLDTNTIKIALISTSYTPNASETTIETAGAARIGSDQTLGTISVTGGVFDAADPVWTSVTAGSTISGALIHKFTTNDAGSVPILWVELTDTATNGGNITVAFDGGANKIFALT